MAIEPGAPWSPPALSRGVCSCYVLIMLRDEPPRWLAPAAAAAMRRAFVQAALHGGDGLGAAQAVALAWHPALPLPMIAEAVASVLRAHDDAA
jgi:hypothetical protein